MTWYWWLLLAVAINWGGALITSYLYVGWLWLISKDVSYEGTIWWRGWYPVLRFKLVSKQSWFARAWRRWYGHALFGSMIHKDCNGAEDDELVEEVIVHELRHNFQFLCLGLLFYGAYLAHMLVLTLMARDGYHDNIFEVDAREAATTWVNRGRPRVFDFGKRY